MRKKLSYRTRTARFRRWSRRPCAVFNSIGLHVTIGHLQADIADISLEKGKSIHSLSLARLILENSGIVVHGSFSDGEPPSPPGIAAGAAVLPFSAIMSFSEASVRLQGLYVYGLEGE